MNHASSRETSEPKFNWFWPTISDTESAIKASREGVWAALITSSVTVLVIIYGQVTERTIVHGIELISLIDVGIMLVAAWFIRYRLNRFAALFGMLFFVVSNLVLRILNLQSDVGGTVVFLALSMMWLNAVRGTFAYHKFQNAELQQQLDETAKSPLKRRVGISVAIIVTIGFLGLMVIGIMAPPEGVVTWEEVDPRNQQALRESGLLADENRILFLYSTSLTDINENLYVLTEDTIVINETVDGEHQQRVVPISSILTLYVVYSDTWLEDSVLIVEDEENLHAIPLSTDSGRDREFIAKLEQLSGLSVNEVEPDESD